jgi:hypothetical protein
MWLTGITPRDTFDNTHEGIISVVHNAGILNDDQVEPDTTDAPTDVAQCGIAPQHMHIPTTLPKPAIYIKFGV